MKLARNFIKLLLLAVAVKEVVLLCCSSERLDDIKNNTVKNLCVRPLGLGNLRDGANRNLKPGKV